MIWKRPEHRAVAAVLDALDPNLLTESAFSFGGGTRIVLEFGEYRRSRDLDFLGSDGAGYSRLRSIARRAGAIALFSKDAALPGVLSEVRADQYGIRFAVRGDASADDVKVEFVHEGRIELQAPVRPPWSPVPCLSIEDCFAEKLLANSDRWADRHVCARDLIDLSILRARSAAIPPDLWRRVEKAYGQSVRDDLRKALDQFRDQEGFDKMCVTRLDVSDLPALTRGLDLLRHDLELTA